MSALDGITADYPHPLRCEMCAARAVVAQVGEGTSWIPPENIERWGGPDSEVAKCGGLVWNCRGGLRSPTKRNRLTGDDRRLGGNWPGHSRPEDSLGDIVSQVQKHPNSVIH
jgi:hypothetical protein